MPQFIVAIDIGTTGTRTIIFDMNGQMHSSAYDEYPTITPQPGHIEQAAHQWWQAALETMKNALKAMRVNARELIAIVVTNQRETVVPVDKDGEPLANALLWQDRRTVKQCESIARAVGDDKIYRTTGLIIDPYFSAAKLL